MNKLRSNFNNKDISKLHDFKRKFDPVASSRWGKAYDYYLRGWLPMQKDVAIVDLGCGGGRLIYFFKERGYKNISGVDISPQQAQMTRQVTRNIHQMDIFEYLKMNHDKFLLIAGIDIVEHFRKERVLELLKLCHDSLKDGGRLILQTPNAQSPFGGAIYYDDFSHEICFTPNMLKRLLNLSGFKNIQTRELGPVPFGYSLISSTRYAIWQIIRIGLKLWNAVEMGIEGNCVFTRVFLISGCK